MTRPLRVTIIAGEMSGDLLGAAVMGGLKSGGDVAFSGIGGPSMESEGLTSRFAMEELSVMGLTEVLPRLPSLLRRIRETADAIIANPPDILLTIDSPDFCLRVAKRVKKANPSQFVAHYVAPSVWAWRPGRAAKMARHVDHVLALLPFEPPLMIAAGMTSDFVGHPVASLPVISDAEAARFRQDHEIDPSAALLCVLPGSRRGEVARHGAVFARVMETLFARHPDTRFVVPVAAPVEADVRALFAGHPARPLILSPEPVARGTAPMAKLTAFAAADAALAVSGTVSLELAGQGTPVVIGYQASALSRAIMRRLVKLETVTLANIITESRAVPEFIFDRFTEENLIPAVTRLLQDPKARALQKEAADDAMRQLGRGGDAPGLRAAQSLRAAYEAWNAQLSGSSTG